MKFLRNVLKILFFDFREKNYGFFFFSKIFTLYKNKKYPDNIRHDEIIKSRYRDARTIKKFPKKSRGSFECRDEIKKSKTLAHKHSKVPNWYLIILPLFLIVFSFYSSPLSCLVIFYLIHNSLYALCVCERRIFFSRLPTVRLE